jgi:hypothetical protein
MKFNMFSKSSKNWVSIGSVTLKTVKRMRLFAVTDQMSNLLYTKPTEEFHRLS